MFRRRALMTTIVVIAAALPSAWLATPATAGTRRYIFPIANCRVSYAHSHHDYPATDIMAARGCLFISPIAGRVDEVTYVDTWRSRSDLGSARGGLSVSVVGDDGVRYYGSHLASISAGIRRGVRVRAGQSLGRVGNTGSARGTATHLHFGMSWPTGQGVWWVRRGMVYPWPYLDSWLFGGQRSPSTVVRALHQQDGTLPRCRSYC